MSVLTSYASTTADIIHVRVTHQTVIQRGRQLVKVEPDIESAGRRDVDPEAHALQSLEDMVTLHLEVFLQCNLHTQTHTHTTPQLNKYPQR